MSHKCYKCGKSLSSQQALNYHLTSRSCTSNHDVKQNHQLEKLMKESIIHVICNENSTILSIQRRNSRLRDVEYIGYSVYDFIINISYKYTFARNHIDTLLQTNDSFHNFFVNDITQKSRTCLRTVLFRDDKKLHVFQFKHEAGDLEHINNMSPVHIKSEVRSIDRPRQKSMF